MIDHSEDKDGRALRLLLVWVRSGEKNRGFQCLLNGSLWVAEENVRVGAWDNVRASTIFGLVEKLGLKEGECEQPSCQSEVPLIFSPKDCGPF